MNTIEGAAVTICPFCREERSVSHAFRYEYEIDGKIYKISMPILLEHVFTTACFETHLKRTGGMIEPTYEKAIEDMMNHMAKMNQRKDNFIKHFGEEESKKPSKVLFRIIEKVWNEETTDAAPSVAMDILEAMTNGKETEEITDNYADLWDHLTAIGAVGWYARGSIKAVRTQRARKEKQDESATSSSDDEAVLARKDEARNAEVATLKSRLAEMEKIVAQLLAEKALAAVDPAPTTPRADIPDADIPDADIPDADIPDADIPDADIPDADVTYLNCCYYCPKTINNIEKAEVIIDTKDNIKNLVCSFACEGIPEEMKDNCAYCGALYFGKTDVCDSCWMTVHESCKLDD